MDTEYPRARLERGRLWALGPARPCAVLASVRQTDRPPLSSGQISVSPLFWGLRTATARHRPSPEGVAAETFPGRAGLAQEAGFSLGLWTPRPRPEGQGEIAEAGSSCSGQKGREQERGAPGVLSAQAGGRPRWWGQARTGGSANLALPGAEMPQWKSQRPQAGVWKAHLYKPTQTSPVGARGCSFSSPFIPV